MPGDGPYARIYLSVRSDPKFEGISSNPLVMGHYVLLLLAAEAHFPEPVAVPRWVDEDVLSDLVKRGIIDLKPDDCYRVHGLAAEREQRLSVQQRGGLERARSGKRNAQGRFDPDTSR